MEATRIPIPSELFAPAESSHFEGTYAVPVVKAGPDLYDFAEPLAWQVDVTNTGDALLVTGTVEGEAKTSCARCVDEFSFPVTGEVEGYFLLGADREAPEDMDDDEFDVLPDDNVIDHLVLERDGGKLKFRVNANSTENISVSVTVPASASLREISAGSYGKVNCKMPLKGPSVSVSVSSYGSVSADIDTPGAAKLDVSSYGKFAGSVRCGDGELRISSYGSAQAPVECRNSCKLTVGSYAKFSNDIKASDLTVEISSGASVGSTLTADALTMRIDSYAKFSGTVTVKTRPAKLTVSSGGSFNGTFSGSSLEASVGSYGKIYLKGAAQVADATVRVSSGANFSAPELRVSDYDLTVSNYAKADVWCSGRLKINASTAAKVTYGGPCTVETVSDNIQRRK